MRLTMQAKLLAAFAAVLLLSGAVSVFELSKLSTEHRVVAQLGEVRVPRVALLGEATTIANKIRKDQLHYILAAAADRPGVIEDLGGDDAYIAANGKAYAKLAGRTPEYARFRDALAAYTKAGAPFRRMADASRTVAAGEFLTTGAPDKAWDEVKAAMAAWQSREVKDAAAFVTRSDHTY